MPLTPSPLRKPLHHRNIDLQGYSRSDGLYDIEVHMSDRKSNDIVVGDEKTIPAGQVIHDMWIRLVIDDSMLIHDVEAAIDASPYRICPESITALQFLIGKRIGSGWSRIVREGLSGHLGCTHLMELLTPLATAAFQTLFEVRVQQGPKLNANGVPAKINSCFAFGSHREVVLKKWPAFATSSPPSNNL